MENNMFKNTELYNKINSPSKYRNLAYDDIKENELYFLLHFDYESLISKGVLEQEKLFQELSQIVADGNGRMTVQLDIIKSIFTNIPIEKILFIEQEETFVRLLKDDILIKNLETISNDIYFNYIYNLTKNPDYKRLVTKIFNNINILLPLMFIFNQTYRDTIITLLAFKDNDFIHKKEKINYDSQSLLVFCLRNSNISETLLITSLIDRRDLTYIDPQLLFNERPSIEEFAKYYSEDLENSILYTQKLAYTLFVLGPDYIILYFKNDRNSVNDFVEMLNKVRKLYSTKHKTPYLTEDFVIFVDKAMNMYLTNDGETNIFKYYYNFSKEKLAFFAFELNDYEIVLNYESLLTDRVVEELLYLIPIMTVEEKKLLLDMVLKINLNSHYYYSTFYEEKTKKRYIYSRLLEFLFKFGNREIRDIIITESFNIIESTKLSEKDKNQIMIDLFENLTNDFNMSTCELIYVDVKEEYGNLDW